MVAWIDASSGDFEGVVETAFLSFLFGEGGRHLVAADIADTHEPDFGHIAQRYSAQRRYDSVESMEREATAIAFSFISDCTELPIWPNPEAACRPTVLTYAVRFRHSFEGAHLP